MAQADFVRPSPYQMITDMRIAAIERGAEFRENDIIDYVNDEHLTNGWKHPDIPLPRKPEGKELIIPADPRRAALIRREDAQAMAEAQAARDAAFAAQREHERSTYEEGNELERLRQRNAQLEAEAANAKRRQARADANAQGIPDGEPSEKWTTFQLAEYAGKKGVVLPDSQGALNQLGKAGIIARIKAHAAENPEPHEAPTDDDVEDIGDVDGPGDEDPED